MQSDSSTAVPDIYWSGPSLASSGVTSFPVCGGPDFSSAQPNVRPAGPCDIPQICKYNLAMAKETEDLELNSATVARGVAELIGDPAKGRYFVLTAGGAAVAQLMITYEWSDWRAGQVWWIQSVYVDPAHRRKGYYRRLYQHILGLARSEGAAGVRLYADNSNLKAQSTYEALGMTNHYKVYETMFA